MPSYTTQQTAAKTLNSTLVMSDILAGTMMPRYSYSYDGKNTPYAFNDEKHFDYLKRIIANFDEQKRKGPLAGLGLELNFFYPFALETVQAGVFKTTKEVYDAVNAIDSLKAYKDGLSKPGGAIELEQSILRTHKPETYIRTEAELDAHYKKFWPLLHGYLKMSMAVLNLCEAYAYFSPYLSFFYKQEASVHALLSSCSGSPQVLQDIMLDMGIKDVPQHFINVVMAENDKLSIIVARTTEMIDYFARQSVLFLQGIEKALVVEQVRGKYVGAALDSLVFKNDIVDGDGNLIGYQREVSFRTLLANLAHLKAQYH